MTHHYEEREVDPFSVRLDPYNPRLRTEEEGSDQDQLRAIMLRRFKAEELAESVLSSGFNSFDPIICIEEEGEVVVREGNRRIATIQALLQPDLAPDRERRKWQALGERLTKQTREDISRVAVRVYSDRNDPEVLEYIGFRHVTGVLKWSALEKAKYIAQMVEDHEWTYRMTAERLGSYPKHVERHYVAYRIVRQVADREIPGLENIETSFGVLLRSLQSPGVIEFLGLEFPDDPQESFEPVPVKHLEDLPHFVEWTFGTEDTAKVLPDSRLLTEWGRILQSGEAVAYLKRSGRPSFDRAFQKSGALEESVEDLLLTAADRLEESVPHVRSHRQSDGIRNAVALCTDYLSQILTQFPDIRDEYGIRLTEPDTDD